MTRRMPDSFTRNNTRDKYLRRFHLLQYFRICVRCQRNRSTERCKICERCHRSICEARTNALYDRFIRKIEIQPKPQPSLRKPPQQDWSPRIARLMFLAGHQRHKSF